MKNYKKSKEELYDVHSNKSILIRSALPRHNNQNNKSILIQSALPRSSDKQKVLKLK